MTRPGQQSKLRKTVDARYAVWFDLFNRMQRLLIIPATDIRIISAIMIITPH
jgi:hypothetical protein